MAYIDVRGPWPVYVRGMKAITLEGYKRNITPEQVELDWDTAFELEEIAAEIAEFIPELGKEFSQ